MIKINNKYQHKKIQWLLQKLQMKTKNRIKITKLYKIPIKYKNVNKFLT